MMERFSWFAVFVLLAAPALGQTAEFTSGYKIQSDGDGAYGHCTKCSFVTIGKTGNFFLRSRCCHCVVNCDFRGECDGDPDPEKDCPASGRSLWIDLSGYTCPDEHAGICSANAYPDAMFSADGMFAKPKRGSVYTNVRITFSQEGLPEPPEGNTWYKLQYINDIPVPINNGTVKRTLVVESDMAIADLYWYDESKKRAQWKRIATGLQVPFRLTVTPSPQ